MGILKRLRGTPICRHEEPYKLCFSATAPYEIVSNIDVDFQTTQAVKRFARYWDMIANSGRFKQTMLLFNADDLFHQFARLSEWLYEQTGRTHRIALNRLFDFMYQAMTELFSIESKFVKRALEEDFLAGGFKGSPKFLLDETTHHQARVAADAAGHTRRQRSHRLN